MDKEFWAFVNEHCGRPSEEQLATLYTIWQVDRAAQKKRDAELVRNASNCDECITFADLAKVIETPDATD